MSSKQQLGAAEYIAIASSLFIPALIGVKFRFSGNRQRTTSEYLLAGKDASMFPVIMSTSVTIMSAAAMLGFPSEVYRYGPQFTLVAFSVGIGMLMASRIFLPVYFRCNVSSIYEFLEMRFGKCTRYTISAMFIVQMVLYMSSVLWSPVLALSVVTDFSTDFMIIICGVVCTFYCFLGGLKAVLWTDAFQAFLMELCLIILFVLGISEVGSLYEIYKRASIGGRMQFFDFQFDFTTRYTFWNTLFRGSSFGLAFYGTSQIQVQRSLSMSNIQRAQIALQWSALIVVLLLLSCHILGLVLYAVFYLCDPIIMTKETGLTKYDQIVPYFIATRLQSIPGLTGLCFAGIFSGSLSTISSALNSLSTVTVVDFIQPLFGGKISPKIEVFIAKVLSIIYGVICICLTFAVASVDSIAQASNMFLSITEGPVLAVFLIGVFTRKTSDRCSMFGLIIGVILVSWIGFGSLFCGYRYPSLPLEATGCKNSSHISIGISATYNNYSEMAIPVEEDVFILYKMPYAWIPSLGFFLTISTTFLASFFIDSNVKEDTEDCNYVYPISRI